MKVVFDITTIAHKLTLEAVARFEKEIRYNNDSLDYRRDADGSINEEVWWQKACWNSNQYSEFLFQNGRAIYTYEGERHPFLQDGHADELVELVCEALIGEPRLPYYHGADGPMGYSFIGREAERAYIEYRREQFVRCMEELEKFVIQYSSSQPGWKFWHTLDTALKHIARELKLNTTNLDEKFESLLERFTQLCRTHDSWRRCFWMDSEPESIQRALALTPAKLNASLSRRGQAALSRYKQLRAT